MASDSREQIVRAALAYVGEQGWESTSLQAVRLRAGVSNGSLFHYFPTREALGGAVIAAGLCDHQSALTAELRAATGRRVGIERVVIRHLRWLQDDRPLARLFLTTPPDVLRSGLDPVAVAENQRFFQDVASWLREHGWTGTPGLAVVLALWIGPAQEYARRQLAATTAGNLGEAADELAAGAWRAVRPLLEDSTEDR
ncbi:TetR/AcrR family transcriptional regulator [Pseudofrankia inefficax]|uniref:Regulatory protein TetR n=1 Tax=Pseudofrankia inefficax (strain DSM 45817 / CECT 9037 / DDB 130130 / EuI1c) TaxID=298654 RepID=E3JD67_PSEI1|nr:TetR/AcrR family transcriptional regulator [Pseudofrankia inefficax]ADP82351.1 regulatory protein TetR [Pseudofrankia inefficax]